MNSHCTQQGFISAPQPEGYITTTQNEVNTMKCPWHIEAQQGQKIDITIIDFSPVANGQSCQTLGYITEPSEKKNETICKSSQRDQHLYSSKSSSAIIQLFASETSSTTQGYILYYKGNLTEQNVYTYLSILPFECIRFILIIFSFYNSCANMTFINMYLILLYASKYARDILLK